MSNKQKTILLILALIMLCILLTVAGILTYLYLQSRSAGQEVAQAPLFCQSLFSVLTRLNLLKARCFPG